MADANLDILVTAKDRASASLKGIDSTLASIGKTAAGVFGGNLLTKGAGRIEDLGLSVIKTGLNFNSLKEQATIAFTTMLGSSTRAKQMLDDLQAFAAKTPFEFPDLITAAQRMQAMGFAASDVIPTLTAVGDAVAAMGGSAELVDQVTRALGQMQAKGKTSAEEMLQLTEAGIPAWKYLAEAIGVSIPQAMKKVSDGAIASGTTIKAITAGIERDFGGMMEKQSHTLNGMLSNLSDAFTQASGTILAPFFNIAEDYLEKLVAKSGDPKLQANLENISVQFLQVGESIFTAYQQAVKLYDLLKTPVNVAKSIGVDARMFLPPQLNGALDLLGLGKSLLPSGDRASNPFSQQIDQIRAAQADRNDPIKNAFVKPFVDMVNQAQAKAADLTKSTAALAAGLGDTSKAATKARDAVAEWNDKLSSALEDGEVAFSEFIDLNKQAAEDSLPALSAAMAGQLEAQYQLAEAASGGSEKMFTLAKNTERLNTLLAQSSVEAVKFGQSLVQGLLGKLRSAFGDLFGQPTKEEAQLELQLAQINQLIAQRSALIPAGTDVGDLMKPFEMMRENVQKQIDVLQANHQLQQAQFTLANQTLLTEQEQNKIAMELTSNQREFSGWLRQSVDSVRDLIPAFRDLQDDVNNTRAALQQIISGAATDLRLAARGV